MMVGITLALIALNDNNNELYRLEVYIAIGTLVILLTAAI